MRSPLIGRGREPAGRSYPRKCDGVYVALDDSSSFPDLLEAVLPAVLPRSLKRLERSFFICYFSQTRQPISICNLRGMRDP